MFGPMIFSTIVARVAAIVALVVAILAGLWYVHHAGYQKGVLEGEAIMAEYKIKQKEALDTVINNYRQREDALASLMIENAEEKQREIDSINAEHSRIVIGLRNRPRRTDPPAKPASCPSTNATVIEQPRESCTGQRLYQEDGEFLIGEAASAAVLKQLLLQCRKAYDNLSQPTK